VEATEGGALQGLRVIELGHGVAGPFAARLLGDLGADVVKVERPGTGDWARNLPPLVDGPDGPQSLLFEYLNWNKRSIALDLHDPGSRPAIEALVREADIVIESFRPGRMAGWGLGYDQLRAWNPRIVLTSISNFGQDGALAQWQATDLIFYAMSGIMAVSGKQYPNGPLKHGLRQSMYCAGLSAAYASLAGYLLAWITGQGEHVDLSIREVMASTLTTATSYYGFMGGIPGRQPVRQDPLSGDPLDTARGFVAVQTSRAAPPDRYAEFFDLPELNVPDYARPDFRVKHAVELRAAIEERLRHESARELFLKANNAGLLVGLVQDVQMLLECDHLAARDFWRPVPGPHPHVLFPGELTRLSGTPLTVRRPAPRLGEHTAQIRAEIAAGPAADDPKLDGAKPDPLDWSDQTRARRDRLPLAGLRVIDLSGIVAGPYMGGLMADLGAEVIKIEGPQRPDTTRYAYGAFIDNDPTDKPWDRGGAYQILNRGKRSLVCDLSVPEGQEVLRRLLAQADVLIENFTPRVLPKWGLTQDVLDEINPRLIVMSNSGFGATGPWRDFRAQGTTLELTSGIGFQTGYAGGRPSKAGQSYPDFISCWSGLTAILAALVARARTGRGQRIDQGMYQLGVSLIPEALLHYQVTGEELGRRGAADLNSLVSGVFETAEADSWVAVSLRDRRDIERASAAVPGLASVLDSADDAQLAETTAQRLTGWVGGHRWDEVVAVLQAADVPAAKVMDMREVMLDPSLNQRGFYEDVDLGPGVGIRPLIGRPYIFRDSEADQAGPAIRLRAPHYGEHNHDVLAGLAGYRPDEIEALCAAGIVGEVPTKQPIAKALDLEALIDKGSFRGVDPGFRQRLDGR
jgi:crotonobetainyl-CoA:carnitine CoA-transferase CaiB-like acyl-CoA transferase